MTLTQIKIFLATAEIGNLTQAAKQVGVTQSAASSSISALEDLYQSKKATILEICTPRFENDQVLKDYFRAIKTN